VGELLHCASEKKEIDTMSGTIPERDWKTIKMLSENLLESFYKRINQQAISILKDVTSSEHEKYLKLSRLMQNSNGIIGECFSDWRRSTITMRLIALQKHGLLSPDVLEQLSEETQDTLKRLQAITKHNQTRITPKH